MVDNFEINGYWWLPENDTKKIPGILKFVADKEIELELIGSFYESTEQVFKGERSPNFDIILGESKGRKLTLLWSQEKDTEIVTDTSYIGSSFHCEYIINGIHFLSIDDIKFVQMNVNFTFLEDWISRNPFRREGNDVIRYVKQPSHEIKIDKINSIISIWSGLSASTDIKTASMSVHSAFIIRPIGESKGLEWYEDVIDCLANFLTLAISKPVYPRTKTSLSEGHKIEIFSSIPNMLHIDDTHFSQMMIPYKDITSYLVKFMNNWFNYSDTLKPVYELFFGTYYAQLYSHFYFLSLMQAIEAFHRRIYGDKGEYLSDEDYKPIRKHLTSSIPANFPDGSDYPSGFREHLKSNIKYGNEYSLRTRLKQLSSIWGSLDPLPGFYENTNDFINNIVFTRNYLTHYEKAAGCRVFEGNDLISINVILKSIFLIILLTHMGIPKLDAFRIVRRLNGNSLAMG
jgi:hypothetical protein